MSGYDCEILASEDSEQVIESRHVDSLTEVAQYMIAAATRDGIPLDEFGEATMRVRGLHGNNLTDAENEQLMVLVEEFGGHAPTDEEIGVYRYLNPNRRS